MAMTPHFFAQRSKFVEKSQDFHQNDQFRQFIHPMDLFFESLSTMNPIPGSYGTDNVQYGNQVFWLPGLILFQSQCECCAPMLQIFHIWIGSYLNQQVLIPG